MSAEGLHAPDTLGSALNRAAGCLAQAGVPGARMDARLLVAAASGLDAAVIFGHPERPLAPDAARRLDRLARRRAAGEPLAHILGVREFWSLPFEVSADVLIPRPDTETVVEAALGWLGGKDGPCRILDLGTGSGCLLLALLSERPEATGVGVDVSTKALHVARRNAHAFGLAERARFVVADWGRGIAGRFDIVVANPPYVADSELAGEAAEVARFEPRLALAGGEDGLDCVRALIPELPRLLADDGALFLEVGAGQASPTARILKDNGLEVIDIKHDLPGIPRCLVATQGEQKRIAKKGLVMGSFPDYVCTVDGF